MNLLLSASESSTDWIGLSFNLVGTLLGAIISAWIAYYIFKRQRKNDIEKEKREYNEKIRSDLNVYVTLLEAIISSAKTQQENYRNYVENVQDNPYANHVPREVTHEHLDRLLVIPTTDIIQMFEYYGEKENYTKVINGLDYFNRLFETARNDFFRHSTTTFLKLGDMLVSVRSELLDKAADFIYDNRGNEKSEVQGIWEVLNEIMINFYQTKSAEPSVIDAKKLLFDPLIDALLELDSRKPISRTILKYCKTGNEIAYSIKIQNEGNASNLNDVSERIDTTFEVLEANLEVMKSKK